MIINKTCTEYEKLFSGMDLICDGFYCNSKANVEREYDECVTTGMRLLNF